jgi:hypothetical protein
MAAAHRIGLVTVILVALALTRCASNGGGRSPDGGGASGATGSGSASGAEGGSSGSSSASGGTPSGSPADDSGASDAANGSSDAGAPTDGGAPSNCPPNSQFPQTSFVDLAAPSGPPLDRNQNDAIPGDAGSTAPQGWSFYSIAGALCRDGSGAGFYVHYASSDKLFIYLEGGGACSSATFCSHNPANIATAFSGGAQSQGQTIGGSLIFGNTPQQPYVPTPASGLTAAYSPGMFDFTNSANPFKDWNGVYVPYCTGDVHFGTADNVTIPSDGVLPALSNQHFVGYRNMQKFIGRIVPTFPGLSQVVLAGASAGGFGAGLNYGMVQDSFGKIPVTVLDDSGPPFRAQYLPGCVQKQWRDLWGFDAALPSDCMECFNADGSGLTDIVLYWLHKYKTATVGIVSTTQDEVMRLFFASGDNACASNNATALTLTQALGGYTGMQYTQGLDDLHTTYSCTGRLATYYIGGQNPNYLNPTYHQHVFRNEFYQAITNDGGTTMAQWAADLISGTLHDVGP